jgi:hypothetical protein
MQNVVWHVEPRVEASPYENLLTAPLLRGLDVLSQYGGDGMTQTYILMSSLETWHGNGWYPPRIFRHRSFVNQSCSFRVISSRTWIFTVLVHMREKGSTGSQPPIVAPSCRGIEVDGTVLTRLWER